MCYTGRYKYITKEESAGVYYVALELNSPEAIDAATYKLNARNEHGESNANLKLNFDGEYRIRSLTHYNSDRAKKG